MKSCSLFCPAHVPTMRSPSTQPLACAVNTARVVRHSRSSSKSPPSDGSWKRSFSFATAKSIGRGASGTVFAVDNTRVIKVFADDEEGQQDLAREKEIFDTLQSPIGSEYIIKCEEQWFSGLVLERLVGTLRDILKTLSKNSPDSPHPRALQWSLESCKGVEFLHEQKVIHGDIGCQNILISADGHAKLCDFAGSMIGDKHAWVAYEIRSQHPLYSGQQPRIETEIFAVGSVLFEIWTWRPPYVLEKDPMVQKKFLADEFPLGNVKHLEIGKVIGNCWHGNYNDVAAICEDLEEFDKIVRI
jgi:serine/threonine protein kinase